MADDPTFERNLGSDGSHGINFEWETTLLTYLRCEKLHQDWKKNNDTGVKSFFVANNVKGVGAFDDVVVRVEYVLEGEVRTKLLLCQCKHVEGATKRGKIQNYLGPKEIQKYFDSFLKVYKIFAGDKISDYKQNTKQCDSKKYGEEIETQMKLQSLFDCTFVECEFLFLSNIDSLPDKKPCFSRIERDDQRSDITTHLFSNTLGNEYRLSDEWCLDNLKCDAEIDKLKDSIIEEFCKMFRVFLKQDDKLDIQINSAIKDCCCTEIIDIDVLRTTMLEEMKLIFGSNSNSSTALTVKTSLLSKLKRFLELKKSSESTLNHHRQNLKISSRESIEEVREKLPGSWIKRQTQFHDLENLKIFRTFIELQSEENSIMILSNEEDVEKFNIANKSQTYMQAKKVYVYVARNIKLPSGPGKNEIFVQIEGSDVDQSAANWVHHLSDKSENIIESSIVNIQGYETTLGTICSNWKDILNEQTGCKILGSEKLIFGRNLPPKPDCYIDRRFRMKILSANLIAEFERLITPACKDRVLLFFVKDKKGTVSEYEFKIFHSLADIRKFIFEEQNIERTFYCFTYFNENFEFKYAFGKECKLFKKNIVDEEYLSNTNFTKITILNDVAGMGKSTTMLALAIKYKEKNNAHFVHFIELNKQGCIIENLETIQTEEEAMHLLACKLLNLKGIDYDLFINACIVTGRVAIFLDAYDELSVVGQKHISALLVILEKTKIARIFVSSRPKFANKLENEILIKPVPFLELQSEEKERCLFEFWKTMMKCEESQERELKLIVNKIIRYLEPKENIMNELLVIPLQIKMIAKAYYNTMISVFKKETDINNIDINLIDLYDKFVRSHAEHYFEDKFAGNWINWDTDKKEREIQKKLRGTTGLGCSVVVPELKIQIEDRELVLETLHDLGLITNMDPPVFIHRTIAEYLAAKYTVTELFSKPTDQETAIIIETILRSYKFDVMRKFINSILQFRTPHYPEYFENKGIHLNIERECLSSETPLHTAVSESNNNILKALLQRDSTLVNAKNDRERTALNIACLNGNAESANILLVTNECDVNVVDLDGNTPLHYASRNALVKIMHYILSDYYSSLGHNPIVATVIKVVFNASKQAVMRYNSINLQNKLGETSLHLAVQSKNAEAVKLLLHTNKCKETKQSNDLKNIFHYAALAGSMEIMQLLFKKIILQGKPAISFHNVEGFEYLLKQKCIRGRTPLHYACEGGHTDIVDLLLKYKCLANGLDRDGDTVLHLATAGNHYKTMEKLLNYGISETNVTIYSGPIPEVLIHECDRKNFVVRHQLEHPNFARSVNKLVGFGDTVLRVAAGRNQNDKILEPIPIIPYVFPMINFINKNEHTPLYLACQLGHTAAVEVLIKHKCSVNERYNDGDTPLHVAAQEGHDKIIVALLNCDISMINVTNDRGETALHVACLFGRTAVVEVLIKHKCSVNERNSIGNTAFHFATMGGHNEIIKARLIDTNQFLNFTGCYGGIAAKLLYNVPQIVNIGETLKKQNKQKRPVNERCRYDGTATAYGNHVKIMMQLLKYNPTLINQTNIYEKTALHYACKYCDFDAVKFLLANDCIFDTKDKENKTPLDYARNRGEKDIVELLEEKGSGNENLMPK